MNTIKDEKTYWRDEVVAFLALSSIKGVGFWSLHKIAAKGLSFCSLLKAEEPEELQGFLRVDLKEGCSWREYQQEKWKAGIELLRKLHSSQMRLIFKDQCEFPERLRSIPDSPHWIFIQGNVDVLNVDSVTIVGTRKPSVDGVFLTRMVLAQLASEEIPTVSGLAEGIDSYVHQESLRYGVPTIAILGNGMFIDFPKGSEELREKIVNNGGAVITEYLPNQTYSGENFVRRNRLQAALGKALIPVEWNIKSGTAHTVEFAFKYGRPIHNLFLPGMEESSQTITFATQSYSAKSWSIPRELPRLIEAIKADEKSVAVQQSLKL